MPSGLEGELAERGAVPCDRDGLARLVLLLGGLDRRGGGGGGVDERRPFRARSAGAGRLGGGDRGRAAGEGAGALACKTDRIDAWVLAELARRDLVPRCWLPDPAVRGERERARFRLQLVRQRTALKNRVHATLIAHGHPCPVSDLFGIKGRALLERLEIPEPWQGTLQASLRLIDELEREIAGFERELRRLGADHRYVPLLTTIPGVAWVLGYTIAAEIGDIRRFPSPAQAGRLHGLCPRVEQSGERDRRGPLTKHGPRYLRWALIEAAQHAGRHPAYQDLYARKKAQHPGPAATRSPPSAWPESSAKRSGTCSPATAPLLRQAPRWIWPHDGPRMRCATGASPNPTRSPPEAP